eukprot:5091066-Pleurochrysis_carterae.AAC.1
MQKSEHEWRRQSRGSGQESQKWPQGTHAARNVGGKASARLNGERARSRQRRYVYGTWWVRGLVACCRRPLLDRELRRPEPVVVVVGADGLLGGGDQVLVLRRARHLARNAGVLARNAGVLARNAGDSALGNSLGNSRAKIRAEDCLTAARERVVQCELDYTSRAIPRQETSPGHAPQPFCRRQKRVSSAISQSEARSTDLIELLVEVSELGNLRSEIAGRDWMRTCSLFSFRQSALCCCHSETRREKNGVASIANVARRRGEASSRGFVTSTTDTLHIHSAGCRKARKKLFEAQGQRFKDKERILEKKGEDTCMEGNAGKTEDCKVKQGLPRCLRHSSRELAFPISDLFITNGVCSIVCPRSVRNCIA